MGLEVLNQVVEVVELVYRLHLQLEAETVYQRIECHHLQHQVGPLERVEQVHLLAALTARLLVVRQDL